MISELPPDTVSAASAPIPEAQTAPEVTRPTVEIYSSGMNVALNRLPKVRCVDVPLSMPDVTLMKWRPNWTRPPCRQ